MAKEDDDDVSQDDDDDLDDDDDDDDTDDDDDDIDCSSIVPTDAPIDVGSVLHDFRLTDQDGVAHTLHGNCNGTTVLFQTAAWCSICRAQIPVLESKYQEYKDAGLEILILMGEGIQSGAAPSEDELRIWTDEGASFPILNDPLYVNSTEFFGKIELGAAMLIGPGVKVVKTSPLDLHTITPQ